MRRRLGPVTPQRQRQPFGPGYRRLRGIVIDNVAVDWEERHVAEVFGVAHCNMERDVFGAR